MNKKLLSLLLSATLILLLFAGCGAASMDAEYNGAYEAPMEAPAVDGLGELNRYDSYDSESAVESTNTTKVTEQKLIKTVNMTAETEDMDQLLSQLDQQISALGGYVEQREIYNGSHYSDYRQNRRAYLTIRIPAEKLNQMVSNLKAGSNVTEYNESVDDVTAAYVDIESHLKALETEQARLLELMEKADTMADLLTIEERLTQVRYSIESITSQLRVYDNKIAYSTVKLHVSEVREYTPVEEETVWQRITGGFTKSLRNLGNFLVDFMVFMLAASPYLVFMAILALTPVVIILLVRRRRRKNARKNDPEA